MACFKRVLGVGRRRETYYLAEPYTPVPGTYRDDDTGVAKEESSEDQHVTTVHLGSDGKSKNLEAVNTNNNSTKTSVNLDKGTEKKKKKGVGEKEKKKDKKKVKDKDWEKKRRKGEKVKRSGSVSSSTSNSEEEKAGDGGNGQKGELRGETAGQEATPGKGVGSKARWTRRVLKRSVSPILEEERPRVKEIVDEIEQKMEADGAVIEGKADGGKKDKHNNKDKDKNLKEKKEKDKKCKDGKEVKKNKDEHEKEKERKGRDKKDKEGKRRETKEKDKKKEKKDIDKEKNMKEKGKAKGEKDNEKDVRRKQQVKMDEPTKEALTSSVTSSWKPTVVFDSRKDRKPPSEQDTQHDRQKDQQHDRQNEEHPDRQKEQVVEEYAVGERQGESDVVDDGGATRDKSKADRDKAGVKDEHEPRKHGFFHHLSREKKKDDKDKDDDGEEDHGRKHGLLHHLTHHDRQNEEIVEEYAVGEKQADKGPAGDEDQPPAEDTAGSSKQVTGNDPKDSDSLPETFITETVEEFREPAPDGSTTVVRVTTTEVKTRCPGDNGADDIVTVETSETREVVTPPVAAAHTAVISLG